MKRSLFMAAGAAIFALAACTHTGETAQSGTSVDPAEVYVAPPAGWRPFSATSPWNTKIPFDAEIDPNSDAMLDSFVQANPLHINMPEWSVAVYYIDSEKTPTARVSSFYSDGYGLGVSSRRPIPSPPGAVPGAPAENGTGFISIVDPMKATAWEMRAAGKDSAGNWTMGFGNQLDLAGNGVSQPWMMAETPNHARAGRISGIPLIAGLIRVEAVKAGRIDHALAFAYAAPKTTTFVSPASNSLGAVRDRPEPAFGMPFGTRIQLDPAFDVENADLSPAGKVIARALQEYGAILVDEAGGSTLYAEASPAALEAWEGLLAPGELHQVFTPRMMATYFRVIKPEQVMNGPPRPRR
ncbi:MAG: hypothetical protein ACK4MQ_03560 [Hyphomonas sp.]